MHDSLSAYVHFSDLTNETIVDLRKPVSTKKNNLFRVDNNTVVDYQLIFQSHISIGISIARLATSRLAMFFLDLLKFLSMLLN